jgi:hypothetical protein
MRSLVASKVPAIPWKRFAGELVTIVLGVFLALLGQEWLNDRFERRQTRFAEDELRHEIMTSAQNAYQRLALADCLHAEVAGLVERLNAQGAGWRPVKRNFAANQLSLRALDPVYGAPVKPWNSAAWDTAIASNSLTFMPVERVIAYVHVYEAIEKIRELQQAEFDSAARLSLLSAPRPMTPELRSAMLMNLGEVDANLAMITNVSEALLYETAQLGYRLTDEERAGFEQRVAGAREVRGACVKAPPLEL